MAKKLVEFYDQANAIGGLKAKMRMAILTKISSSKAPEEPDSAENIAIFQKALDEIKKEYK